MGCGFAKSRTEINSEITPHVKVQQNDSLNESKDVLTSETRSGEDLYKLEMQSGKSNQQPDMKINSSDGVLDSEESCKAEETVKRNNNILDSEGSFTSGECVKNNNEILDREVANTSGEEQPTSMEIFTKADLTQYNLMTFETVDSDDEQDEDKPTVSGRRFFVIF